ncbi:hypothetical protein LVD17_11145 [Fulvivirga ulvae]|uniref:O-antigen ligase family protein n=1 Tax=Fulvivirga ulvae TaxID=2904245 RepID=UPI001F1F7D49|nr:O-antigen ligase family protein [Fulvivirga ulvae]UII34364.1 hypothetical protein LVD17_11145 [Fulvivirga ulvae]
MKALGIILLQIILLELILGGGGRFTAVGPVSLRMILFGIAIIYTAHSLWKQEKINSQYSALVLAFIIVTVISVLIGNSVKADSKLIFQDVKPLSYFLILPFFALTIQDKSLLINISKLFIYGSLFLSIAYLITIILMNGGIIPFKKFYALTSPTEEFFYRGELAFFYKGFIFLSIGLIFVYFIKPKHWAIMAAIIICAIILTFTRGFIFALLLTGFTYLLIHSVPLKLKLPSLLVLLIATIVLVYYGNDIYSNVSRVISKTEISSGFTRQFEPDKLLGNREFSDSERKKQLNQVLERTTIASVFLGHGFGIGVPVRPVHMEISYLEIFHKQGLLGLLFWGTVFLMLTKKFQASKFNQSPYSSAFYFGSLFIFFQSATNQYFNNPIGMSFILVALVCLDLTSKNDG